MRWSLVFGIHSNSSRMIFVLSLLSSSSFYNWLKVVERAIVDIHQFVRDISFCSFSLKSLFRICHPRRGTFPLPYSSNMDREGWLVQVFISTIVENIGFDRVEYPTAELDTDLC